MTYHKLILGATFAAAGLLTKSGGDCLVIEPKPSRARILGALAFGTSRRPLQPKLRSLSAVSGKGGNARGKGCLFDCASLLNASC
ncbi:MAG: hypothetical protein ACLVG9_00165 [Eubacteriales bacterium]